MTQTTDRVVSKISLKIGALELAFEGSEHYIKNELPSFLEFACNNLSKEVFSQKHAELVNEVTDSAGEVKNIQMTTNTIASKLNIKTGSDLVIAACAHLCLVKGKNVFERKEILTEMQNASNYYKKSYGSNLSAQLSSLVKDGKLIERSKEEYAFSGQQKQELEVTLV